MPALAQLWLTILLYELAFVGAITLILLYFIITNPAFRRKITRLLYKLDKS